jgi:hypothetical protein
LILFFIKIKFMEDDCIICLEKLDSKVILTLPCKHSFHTECYLRWYRENQNCCYCREELKKDEFVDHEKRDELFTRSEKIYFIFIFITFIFIIIGFILEYFLSYIKLDGLAIPILLLIKPCLESLKVANNYF